MIPDRIQYSYSQEWTDSWNGRWLIWVRWYRTGREGGVGAGFASTTRYLRVPGCDGGGIP